MKPLAFLATVFTARRGLLPLVIVPALLLSGCATIKAYEGPELTKSEISVIDGYYSHGWMVGMFGILPIPMTFRHETRVLEIDGRSGGGGWPYHVLPGQHSARVIYSRYPHVTLCSYLCISNYSSGLSIDFTAEAGHEYRIPAERRDERDWIWVEDITTGKVVAGEKPPDEKGERKPPATPPE